MTGEDMPFLAMRHLDTVITAGEIRGASATAIVAVLRHERKQRAELHQLRAELAAHTNVLRAAEKFLETLSETRERLTWLAKNPVGAKE